MFEENSGENVGHHCQSGIWYCQVSTTRKKTPKFEEPF